LTAIADFIELNVYKTREMGVASLVFLLLLHHIKEKKEG
jgi:hypothetical protein